jgi:hypothetical protein
MLNLSKNELEVEQIWHDIWGWYDVVAENPDVALVSRLKRGDFMSFKTQKQMMGLKCLACGGQLQRDYKQFCVSKKNPNLTRIDVWHVACCDAPIPNQPKPQPQPTTLEGRLLQRGIENFWWCEDTWPLFFQRSVRGVDAFLSRFTIKRVYFQGDQLKVLVTTK